MAFDSRFGALSGIMLLGFHCLLGIETPLLDFDELDRPAGVSFNDRYSPYIYLRFFGLLRSLNVSSSTFFLLSTVGLYISRTSYP